MWHDPVFIAFGSNLGDSKQHVLAAHAALGVRDDLVIERFSSLYRSRAMYESQQPDFVNAVCRCKTTLSPTALLACLKSLERTLGRVPSPRRYAPRVIDLDILYYEQRVLVEQGLTLPHPLRAERAFVLVPLAEIAATFHDPQYGCSVADLKARLERGGSTELEKV